MRFTGTIKLLVLLGATLSAAFYDPQIIKDMRDNFSKGLEDAEYLLNVMVQDFGSRSNRPIDIILSTISEVDNKYSDYPALDKAWFDSVKEYRELRDWTEWVIEENLRPAVGVLVAERDILNKITGLKARVTTGKIAPAVEQDQAIQMQKITETLEEANRFMERADGYLGDLKRRIDYWKEEHRNTLPRVPGFEES